MDDINWDDWDNWDGWDDLPTDVSGGGGFDSYDTWDSTGGGGGMGFASGPGTSVVGDDGSGLFGKGGAGTLGIGGLFALLQGMQQRKRAKEPTLSDAERAAIAQDAARANNRALSATVGNPALNPGAQEESQGRIARMLANMEYQDRGRRRGEMGRAESGIWGGGGMLAQALMAYLANQGN